MNEALQRWTRDLLERHYRVTDFTTEALLAEASYRQFTRIRAATATWVLMESPPDRENNRQFCYLADVFAAAGLGVPRVLASNHERGWYLLNDLGSNSLEAVYATPAKPAAISAAIDAIVTLQGVQDPGIPLYSRQRFADELHIFDEWFLQALLDSQRPAQFTEAFEILVERTQSQPQCCVHRDFHCRNLLFDAERQLGIVDFQDALVGPLSYDLASLLRDCYYTFSETEIAHWRNVFIERTPHTIDPARLRRDLDYAAVQRQLKAIGIFSRLRLRDGKTSHIGYVEPLLIRLADLCDQHPELVDLGGWLITLAPAVRRRLEDD